MAKAKTRVDLKKCIVWFVAVVMANAKEKK